MIASVRFLTPFVALTIGLLAAVSAGAVAAAPVQTESGLVEGVPENNIVVFKGIPFAAPPVGPLRWRAPQAPAPWPGVRNADRFSPICMQRGSYPEDAPPEPMSEDCLALNVWAPSGAADAKLPVMVWIYGGGLSNGTASTPLYAGDALARRNVVVVTANYRLGALGFLAHPDLTRESAHRVSGNYGLLDQLAALGWVQRNIAAFGGDPGNVTVFGQSSGSISISALVASPLARGLFRRAIGESGGLFEPLDIAPEFKLEGAEQAGKAFAARIGAPSLRELRLKPASEIVAKPFGPHAVVDGYVLAETPYQAYAGGRQNDVDILIGSNEAEGLAFLPDHPVTAANLTDELGRDFPPFIVSLIGPKTPSDDKAALAAFVAFESDMRFGWDMWAWARLHAGAGKRQAYFYRFSHTPPDARGAGHGAEMAYVFDHLDQKRSAWTDKDRRIASLMAAYWTNFAKTGNPNGADLPNWPAFAPARPTALLIGDDIRAGTIANEADLIAIDRLYGAVRFVATYAYALAAVGALAVLALLWWLARLVFRRLFSSA